MRNPALPSITSRLLKKPHLPSAGLRLSLRVDAIRPYSARLSNESIFGIRVILLVPRIDPSRHSQVGGYNTCAQSPRSDVLASTPPLVEFSRASHLRTF